MPLDRRAFLHGFMALPLLASACVTAAPPATESAGKARVVYHIDDSARAIAAIRNINNHLRAAPSTQIVVVALGHGIDFLLKDAKDDRGNPYEPMIDDLVQAGVAFRACNNSLAARQIPAGRLHPDVSIVESGVAEIGRLQFNEHYAYIKP